MRNISLYLGLLKDNEKSSISKKRKHLLEAMLFNLAILIICNWYSTFNWSICFNIKENNNILICRKI